MLSSLSSTMVKDSGKNRVLERKEKKIECKRERSREKRKREYSFSIISHSVTACTNTAKNANTANTCPRL